MICTDIQRLIDYSIFHKLIEKEDALVIRNMLMDVLGVADWEDAPAAFLEGDAIDDILLPLIDYACEHGVIEDTTANRDLFDTKLMGIVTPMPREIIRDFHAQYADSPEAATEWYYDISKKLNYVRAGRIAKDLKWTYACAYGDLDITINRSKPEKDPRDIAKAGATKSAAYPKCQLCAENMGYAGRKDHPARQNLRPIPITINGGDWYLQYSPYGYYNEHCIVFNSEHIPMVIDAAVFKKLFDFIGMFPHYFVGSNADLPIVGGSILSHEHFQGGHYTFAMAVAPEEDVFALPGYPDVHAATVKWPMSVIRLRSANQEQLSAACADILKAWRAYTDEAANIYAFTDGVPHNTITPIARMKDGLFECDLVLRNNITSEERPLGVYHPNPTLHHIKKENIGLIEVMGLAVLPARLALELEAVKTALLNGDDLCANPQTASHAAWAAEFLPRHPEFCADNAMEIIRAEVGAVFEQVLLDAGVFKRDADGRAAFGRFIASITG
jgi:UDPglucose--hexose-1-phosphate uridylyltransferase